jgi:hypothetical protein
MTLASALSTILRSAIATPTGPATQRKLRGYIIMPLVCYFFCGVLYFTYTVVVLCFFRSLLSSSLFSMSLQRLIARFHACTHLSAVGDIRVIRRSKRSSL